MVGSQTILLGRHDTQHNDIQPNDTQHKGLKSDIEYNDTQHNETLPLCRCHCAECRDLFIGLLSVIMLSVVMLNLVMLNIFMLNVVMLSVVAPPFHNKLEC